MRRDPEPTVVSWLDDQPAESIWTTSITVFEVRTALELLKPSRRRQQLERAFGELLANELEGRVQSFDPTAALTAASIAAKRQRADRTLEIRDAQIAGIATARKARLATGNTRHFEQLGIALVDPRCCGRAAGHVAAACSSRRRRGSGTCFELPETMRLDRRLSRFRSQSHPTADSRRPRAGRRARRGSREAPRRRRPDG